MIIGEAELVREMKDVLAVRPSRYLSNVQYPVSLKITGIEVPIRIEGAVCGKIDACGIYHGIPIVIEVKGCPRERRTGTDLFWEATKAIAYAKVLSGQGVAKYRPATMLPADTITGDIIAISIYLGLPLFGYRKDDETNKIIVSDFLSGLYSPWKGKRRRPLVR